MRSQGSIYTWCGCRDQRNGRRLGSRRPRRGQPGHGSWYLSMELPAGADGQRRRIRRGGFPDQAAAHAALSRLMMPPPGSPADQLMTVGQWLRHWLASRNAPRFSTLRSYASHIRLYLDPCLGQILLADLRTAHVQAMLTAIARQRAAAGRPVTAATLARIKAALRAALNAAIRAGYLTDNPACRTELPSARRPRPVVWTAARIHEWGADRDPPASRGLATRTHRLFPQLHPARPAICRLSPDRAARATPRRSGRAALVRRRPRQRHRRDLPATAAIRRAPIPVSLCPPKTPSSHRVVALDRTTVAVLRRHRATQQAERTAMGEGYHDSGYVFTGLGSDPIAPDRLTRHFRQLSDAAGLPPVRLHDLRHGAATLAQMGRIASDASSGRLREHALPAVQLAAVRRTRRAGTAGGRADLELHRPRAADASMMRLAPLRGVRHRCAC